MADAPDGDRNVVTDAFLAEIVAAQDIPLPDISAVLAAVEAGAVDVVSPDPPQTSPDGDVVAE